MNLTSNCTTIAQARRLLAAGCPKIKLRMVGHSIVPEPLSLGRLWDIAHRLGLEYEFPLELTSKELTESLVAAIEDYYVTEKEQQK